MKSFKPSRIINESSVFMGLNTKDIVGLSFVFVFFLIVLNFFGLQLWAFSIAICTAFVLSKIRLEYRRKIIRDTLRYYLGDRVVRNRENSRFKKT